MKHVATLMIMVCALALAGRTALAVTKQCPSGTMEASACKGTAKSSTSSGNDIGAARTYEDYINALSGNDWINGAAGGTEPTSDTTVGGPGNDVYSYRDGFGVDMLKDSSGTDTVNLSAATGGAGIFLIQEWQNFGYDRVFKNSADKANFSTGTVVERAVGTSGSDEIYGGKEANTLKPGPGHVLNDDVLVDWGGCSSTQCLGPGPLLASNDTYKGFGFGISNITDYGGSTDTLDLSHIPSDEATFEFSDDTLIIYLGNFTSQVQIFNYLSSRQFRIEKIVFSDTTITSVN